MDIILLGITVVSLIVALVMSVTAWRLMREEKARSAARVAALSVAATTPEPVAGFVREPETPKAFVKGAVVRASAGAVSGPGVRIAEDSGARGFGFGIAAERAAN